LTIVFLSLFAFVLGSIPTSLIIAKNRGIDIRKVGSGNIGATNVLRALGKGPAILTLVGDILKGLTAVLVARFFEVGMFYEGIVGLCSILGHNFPVFLKFRGGKGVATSIGVLSVYSPQTALVTIVIWLMTVFITRYSSLGALISFGLLPLSIIMFDTKAKFPIALIITLIVYARHAENISRLFKGTERKVGKAV